MLNPMFWKKVQGQNILGDERLQNAKYLVSKCCLKRIPMVTSILILVLLSWNKTQLMKPKKVKSGIQHRNRALPKNSHIDCDGVQLHQYWTTLPVYVYIYVPRPAINRMERMCQHHGSNQTPALQLEFKTHKSINSLSITYAVEEFFCYQWFQNS